MKLQVKLFAGARDAVGAEEVAVEVPDDSTVAQLREALSRQYPALAPWTAHLLVAVDRQYASDNRSVGSESEIACFPPVSGG